MGAFESHTYCNWGSKVSEVRLDFMGKQINYWMDYDSFVLLAQKALDLGCVIVKEDFSTGTIQKSTDTSVITQDSINYYFHLPEAGILETEMINGKEKLKRAYCASGNTIIEAGYSHIWTDRKPKRISRARLFCISGYYAEDGEYIPRPDCLTKVYNNLARYVKKLAPYTELMDTIFSTKDETYGQEIEYKHKEYITDKCLNLRNNEGYKLN